MMCDMTPSYVWHDAFICVTWLNTSRCVHCIDAADAASHDTAAQRRHDWALSHMYLSDVTRKILSHVTCTFQRCHTQNIESCHLYILCHLYIPIITCVIWLMWLEFHMCDMTNGSWRMTYVWYDWWDSIVVCVTWLMGLDDHMCDMTDGSWRMTCVW